MVDHASTSAIHVINHELRLTELNPKLRQDELVCGSHIVSKYMNVIEV